MQCSQVTTGNRTIEQAVIVDIVMPSKNMYKARAWKHSSYAKDSATGKTKIGTKVTCRLCQQEIALSGGTTNLKNH